MLKNVYRWQLEAQDALKLAYEESGRKLPKPKRKLIEMRNGTFFYKDIEVRFKDPEALYAKVFRAIFKHQSPNGYAPYTAINRSIELEGEEKILDKGKAAARIRNAVAELFRRVKLPKTIPTGEPLLEAQKGKGIILRNLEIE